jgi:uncharacterized protein (UPF0276 family)
MADAKRRGPVGVGLGLRWEFLEEIVDGPLLDLAFFEVSPENYMRRGGYYPAQIERVKARYPLLTHGLTLSIGAAVAPDPSYLRELRTEIERLGSPWHSDHLCFSSVGTRMLHDLLPLPFTLANVSRVSDRVRSVEDVLGVPLALENISYYADPGASQLSEAEFITRILDASGTGLLLDVNNAFVNAQNHSGNAQAFLAQIPLERVVQIHVAGHTKLESGLIVDTHGTPVCDPVFELLEWTLERTGPLPVLLERDNHVPPLPELLSEIAKIQRIYQRALSRFEERHARSA